MWTHSTELKTVAIDIKGQWLEDKIWTISTDSRKIAPGQVFWALPGERFDGHDYIFSALQRGASAVVTARPVVESWLNQFPQVTWVFVGDTLKALQELARLRVEALKKDQKTKVLGITGSNGKTTCKEFTYQLARRVFPQHVVHGNQGSFNNHFGVPFNILSAPPDVKILICELGMNHAGEITALSQIAQPDLVVCTMVGTAHIENFGSQEGIAKAKEEIYVSNPNALAVFNLSNSWTLKMAQKDLMTQRLQRIFFVHKRNPPLEGWDREVHLEMDAQVNSQGFLEVWGHIDRYEGRVELPLLGEHQVINIMAASAFHLGLGASPKDLWASLKELSAPWGRNQLVRSARGCTILFDGYNANPESMMALRKTLQSFFGNRPKVGVLGDMKELGDFGFKAHYELGMSFADLNARKIFFVGQYGAEFSQGFYAAGGNPGQLSLVEEIDSTFISQLREEVTKDTLVFIKASRAMKLEKVVEALDPIDFTSLYG
ncbi:MAG: UDP-N-acetylmuramoyl-tripeptide--D-alanyl-D-alanine ligase [Bdellovibrionaceae bacterium]|nr:UDP-N-acetylmuramoyl-tripeptide--D-alanyl-D-alanine ligase [Pseudobdellovibrionaceae bacterium]MDW8190113.1 UDP-N-acetylmuramoyl-tripeptide--D-alanyl-D-alanine ligase [Pseudobdellovibrionaceae bacterium]